MVPPKGIEDPWRVKYAWQGSGVGLADTPVTPEQLQNGKVEIKIPFGNAAAPGIAGTLRFVISSWNKGAQNDD